MAFLSCIGWKRSLTVSADNGGERVGSAAKSDKEGLGLTLFHSARITFAGALLATAALLSGCIEQRSKEELKDSLIHGFDSFVHTFDPARQIYAQETIIMSVVLEGLARWNHDLELEPALATHWELSDDGMQWRFFLREGVTFHDGTPFNADAVKWHFDRIMDPATASTRRTQLAEVDSVEVINDYEVMFHMRIPNSILVERLASAFASIPSPAAYERYGSAISENPVGTGPYMFDEWKPDVHIRFKRNPDHWMADEYHLERLEFRPIRENTTRLILLEQGALDMANVAVPHVQVAERNPSIELQTTPALNIRYIGFNTGKPPFDDVRVRRAANYAINKEAMIKYSFFGVGEAATGPLPSILADYNPDIYEYTYDPDRARELLEEAGYGDGVTVTLWTHESGLYRLAADAVAEDLRRIGINVRVQLYDNATFTSNFDEYVLRTGERFPLRDGVYDMFLGGWVGGHTAHGFLDLLFHSESFSNKTFYANEEVDELLDAYKELLTPEERRVAFHRIQEIVVEEAPWIFAFHGQENIGYNSRVRGFRIDPAGRLFFEGVRVVDDEEEE